MWLSNRAAGCRRGESGPKVVRSDCLALLATCGPKLTCASVMLTRALWIESPTEDCFRRVFKGWIWMFRSQRTTVVKVQKCGRAKNCRKGASPLATTV